MGLLERRDERQEFLPRHTVHLVEYQNAFAGEALSAVEEQFIGVGQRPAGIHHQEQHINAFEGSRDFAHHLAAEGGLRGMQAGRINKDDLPLRPRDNALNAVARCLRLGGDDGHLLPNQTID